MNESDLLAILALTMKRLAPYHNRESAILPALFIAIAQEPGCTCRYLKERFAVDQSAISKATRTLGDGMDKHKQRHKWPGRELIYSEPDTKAAKPTEKKHQQRLRYNLTEKGQQIVDEIWAELNRRYLATGV